MKSFKIPKVGMLLLALIMLAFTFINWVQTGMVSETGSILTLIFGAGGKSLAAFAFGSLTFDDQSENMGGFGSTIYIAIDRDINVWAWPTPNPSTDDECVLLNGDFVMEDGKFFIEAYGTPDTVGANAETQGERDAKSFKIKGEFLYPSTRKAAKAFARKINNAHGVVIMIDPNTGKRELYGSEILPVSFSASVNYGKAPADRRGVTVNWECDSFVPSWEYNGEILLSSGTLPSIS